MIREILQRQWRRWGLVAAVISLVNTSFLVGRWRALSDGLTVISLALALASLYGSLHARRSNLYDKRPDHHA